MCGIIGYIGYQNAADILLAGLSNLEYRGYDSAGISVMTNGCIQTIKSKGRLKCLADKIESYGKPQGACGIGHTRWATHGEPSDINSHPHYTDNVSIVHNGIIENYLELRKELSEKGYTFTTQTDTESVAKLLDCLYNGDPVQTLASAIQKIDGSYALGVLFKDHPDTIYAIRKDSPLLIALGENENFIASDMPAVLQYTKRYILLEQNEIAVVKQSSVSVFTSEGVPVIKEVHTANWDISKAQKDGFDTFMLKEIFEQPRALHDTISPRIKTGIPTFENDGIPADYFSKFNRIKIVACGTAMHAGMIGKNIIEQLARIPVEVDLASEFRYRNPILYPDDLVIVISQSGETADSLAALRLAKSQGIATLGVVNVTGSSISRETDHCIYTYAGPEIAVASTKAYSVQMAVMYLLAIHLAFIKQTVTAVQAKNLTSSLVTAAQLTRQMLTLDEAMEERAKDYVNAHSLFFIGRGLDYCMSLEGSLKLKEISYIHCEAYAAGELKHGTISLITELTPVVALATQEALIAKMISNIKEVHARGGSVFMLAKDGMPVDTSCCDHVATIPPVEDLFTPILTVIPLQLLAYHTSLLKGCDVDKPRNLAKSVTVE